LVALDVGEPFTQTVATEAGEVVDGVAGECDRVGAGQWRGSVAALLGDLLRYIVIG
jgi:predicted butyrate kinase (DUF1464 family)